MNISKTNNTFQPHHKVLACKTCIKYNECKSIESRHKKNLEKLDGNWREIVDNGNRVGTPIRRCSHAIVETHHDKFFDKSVLEIGCGPLSEIDYDFCRQHNIRYTGLDPDRLPLYHVPFTKGKSLQNKCFTSLLKLLKIKKYPKRNALQQYIKDYFPSPLLHHGSFDMIYGNSTVEHWHQDEKDVQESLELYRRDIDNCNDLLTPGGMLLMNCPIHVHGNQIFVLGKIDLIEQFFSDKWKSVEFEHWRESHDDLMAYSPGKRKESFKELYNLDLENIWLLNIVAIK